MTNEIAKQVPKFKVGDKVDFTNDYGVEFPNKTITGIEHWDGHPEPRYFFEPTDSPWFSSRESHFELTPIVKDNPLKGTW